MAYFVKICVSTLIISAYIDKIDSASEDRSCYYCREDNEGSCHNMNDVKSVRCDLLIYSRASSYEIPSDEKDNTDNFRGNAVNGGGLDEMEARSSNGRLPVSGTQFRCVSERRRYNSGNKNTFLRTCVLDQFAHTYCQSVAHIGQTHVYDKYESKDCHICDSDNCNFANSLRDPYGLTVTVVFVIIKIIIG